MWVYCGAKRAVANDEIDASYDNFLLSGVGNWSSLIGL